MKTYSIDKLRNVALLGHGGEGKTSLAESMLFLTKGTDRLGNIAQGNTICDYDSEEIKRQISISTALAPIEFDGYKINILDTPGYFDFEGEVYEALRVCDCAVICVSAKGSISVGTEKAFKLANKKKKARIFYVSKIDEENADFFKVFDMLREKFGISVCPVVIPINSSQKDDNAVCDLITKKAYAFKNGSRVEVPLPESFNEKVLQYRALLTESVAETSDELMDKFFNGEDFTEEEYIKGIHAGVRDTTIAPVFAGSAVTGVGTQLLIEKIIKYAPSPDECADEIVTLADGSQKELKADENGPACAVVFKTVTDQYGRFSYFKVLSGKITADMTLDNTRTSQHEKLGHIYFIKGKKNEETSVISCGDIGAVAKLNDTKTGDTLCAASKGFVASGIDFPSPCYFRAIAPKVKGQEEKIASGLTRLHDEDIVFSSYINTETHQHIIGGMGDIHIDVLCSKLKNKFGVEVDLFEPRVPYREKIRKKIFVEGKHKKQSGGHGQYGHVKMEFEPCDSLELVFEEKIFGGSVPKNYHPAVEKGIRESMAKGVLAGFPVVNLKATLVDGSYHDVDSNELSFKMAARLAYKAGLPQASPVLLEPVGSLKVYIPEKYMGDIIGDLNKRRGQIIGMNPYEDNLQEVDAEVPMAEMQSYAIDLRSITRGRGSFSLEFLRYDEAPLNIQQQVIEANKKHLEEEEDD